MLVCSKHEFFTFAGCFTIAGFALTSWDEYESCSAPIHVFLLQAALLVSLDKFISLVCKRSFFPLFLLKSLNFFHNLLIHPMFFYVTVKGLEWQTKIVKDETDCNVAVNWFWLPCLVLGYLLVIDAWLIFLVISNFVVWKRFRTLRRRQGNANEIQILDEYLNGGAMAQLFINRDTNDEAEEEVFIPLTVDEVQKISRSFYRNKFESSRQSYEDACPVCFEDYKEGDDISILPQCNHIFHSKCIYDWFRMSIHCPMCRCSIRENLSSIHISTPHQNIEISPLEKHEGAEK